MLAGPQLVVRAQNNNRLEHRSGTYLFIPNTVFAGGEEDTKRERGPEKITLPGPNDIAAWLARRNFMPADLQEILKPIGELFAIDTTRSSRRG